MCYVVYPENLTIAAKIYELEHKKLSYSRCENADFNENVHVCSLISVFAFCFLMFFEFKDQWRQM